uniref:Uncharacterized protein n=1 Tax=Alexandrium catenella TaxID=2925 RepID=A0A7S1LY30_ALECA|mmetsp:Transcript_15846/g.43083  ORF Transcript_15846/g.43083 Transcript_15846/m.43083 type:complete len:294 (+) Transcript_15846:103-984(+)
MMPKEQVQQQLLLRQLQQQLLLQEQRQEQWQRQQQQQSPLLPQQELQQEQHKQQEQQQVEHEQQHRQEHQQQEQQERQGQREQQQQAPVAGTLRSLDGGVRGPRLSATAAATAASREGCAQTDIVWAEQGFRCTRCSRPPRPPAAAGEGPPLARPPHQLRPRQRQRRRSKMRRGTQLRIEGAPPTPKPTRQHTLALCCFSWNMRLPRNRCCDMHALLEEASCVLQDLKEQGCKEEDAEVAFYCSSCGIITTDAVEADSDCTNCGGSFTAAPRAGEGDSSSSSSDAGGNRRASL